MNTTTEQRETVIAEEREQLREEFREEELKYNEKLKEDEEALEKAVDERMRRFKDKHGDLR